MIEPVIHALDGRHALATFGNVVIGTWLRLPEASEAAACGRLLARHAAANPRGVGYLHLSAPHAHDGEKRPISDDARSAFARMLGEVEGLRCFAMVVRATGFGGAIIRGTVTSLLLSTRTTVPNASFPDVHSAASWMETELRLIHDGLAAPGALASAAEVVDARTVALASAT